MNNNITMVYHLGGAYTDADQLTSSLKKDPELLNNNRVLLRRPNRYRGKLKDLRETLQGQKATLEQQENLLEKIIPNETVDRSIFSDDGFMGAPSQPFHGGSFYKNAGGNTSGLRNLFPDNQCEFFLAIRNPASFIPEALAECTDEEFRKSLNEIDVETVLWSDVIRNIQQANPDCPITVWCYEDTPVLWPTILGEIAAVNPTTHFKGDFDIIENIIQPNGLKLLKKYLDERPEYTEHQRRHVKAIFLEKFIIEDTNEVEAYADLGWSQSTIDSLTKTYESDVELIKAMTEVNLISV